MSVLVYYNPTPESVHTSVTSTVSIVLHSIDEHFKAAHAVQATTPQELINARTQRQVTMKLHHYFSVAL